METVNSIINELPSTPWGCIKFFIAILPLLGRMYTALKNEGGFKGIWKTVVLGQTVKKEEAK